MNKILSSKFVQNIKSFIVSHKIWSAIILVVVIALGYYAFGNKSTVVSKYTLTTVTKGTVISSVSGSGQVEASSTIDLQAKNAGNIVSVSKKVGDYVEKGTVIASVDSRDARIALRNAQISLSKLTQSPDKLSLLQKQNSSNDAKDSLVKSYDSGWSTASSSMDQMSSILDSLSTLYSSGYLRSQNVSQAQMSQSAQDKIALAQKEYYEAKTDYENTNSLYKTLSRTSNNSDIDNLISHTYTTAQKIALAVKDTQSSFSNVSNAFGDQTSSSTITVANNIITLNTNINNYLANILSAKNNIKSSQNSVVESTQSLTDLVSGTSSTSLDIESAKLNLESKQNTYDDCFIKAPISGVIATLTAQVGQSSGSSIGTLITKQKLASVSFNEVDVAKIKVGQKSTLTFDAISGLSIAGEVASVDPVGTVSSGVVNYNVKISFATQDDRIKPGMTANAVIVTNLKQDVLTLPSSAVKTKNNLSYVEEISNPIESTITGQFTSATSSKQVSVTIGLVGSSSTEIVSGLTEGDKVVLKTISGTTTSSTTKTPSATSLLSGNKAGGGASAGAVFHN